jgi:hypothetical protein
VQRALHGVDKTGPSAPSAMAKFGRSDKRLTSWVKVLTPSHCDRSFFRTTRYHNSNLFADMAHAVQAFDQGKERSSSQPIHISTREKTDPFTAFRINHAPALTDLISFEMD